MRKEKRYDRWDKAPMRWHYWTIFFLLPITALITISSIIVYRHLGPLYIAAGVIIALTAILAVVFSAMKKWVGPLLIMAVYIENLACCFAQLILLSINQQYDQISSVVGTIIAYAIYIGANIIYYKKRMGLFKKFKTNKSMKSKKENQYQENSVDLLQEIMEHKEEPKKPSRIPMILLSILSGVLSAALITVCVLWWYQNQIASSNIEALQEELEDLEVRYDARGEILEDVREDRSEMMEENNFYRRHACIVTESGEKYHRYGCQYLSDITSFWIYNTEAAESKGYEPCSNCYDNTSQDIYDRLEDMLEDAREEDKKN